jgi:hypothetical protein
VRDEILLAICPTPTNASLTCCAALILNRTYSQGSPKAGLYPVWTASAWAM